MKSILHQHKFLKDKNNVEKTGPLFAQITDNRGTLEGWTLSAKQNSAFTSATKGQTISVPSSV